MWENVKLIDIFIEGAAMAVAMSVIVGLIVLIYFIMTLFS